jgi:hypothetical protein
MAENELIINRVKTLSLYELIGAPLQALVQAEAQAMQSTVDYIRDIGFEEDTNAKKGGNSNALGKIRMVSFTYSGINEAGQEVERKFSIPLLSLIPIPLLSVKNAEIDFSLKVADFYFEQNRDADRDPSVIKKEGAQRHYLSGKRAAIKATMGSMGREEMQQTQYQIRVKMNVEQSDMPAGLQKMLTAMNQQMENK